MGLSSQIKNGGWGAVAIYLYSLFVFLHWNPPLVTSDRVALAAAAGPALLVMFFVVVENDRLNDYWAGGNLKRSAKRISEITGESDFYESAPEEVKETVNDFDELAYGHHVAIISGIVLAVAVPITGYAAAGLRGLVVGVIVSFGAFRTLSVRSYRELNQLAKELPTPYEENYENQ